MRPVLKTVNAMIVLSPLTPVQINRYALAWRKQKQAQFALMEILEPV